MADEAAQPDVEPNICPQNYYTKTLTYMITRRYWKSHNITHILTYISGFTHCLPQKVEVDSSAGGQNRSQCIH